MAIIFSEVPERRRAAGFTVKPTLTGYKCLRKPPRQLAASDSPGVRRTSTACAAQTRCHCRMKPGMTRVSVRHMSVNPAEAASASHTLTIRNQSCGKGCRGDHSATISNTLVARADLGPGIPYWWIGSICSSTPWDGPVVLLGDFFSRIGHIYSRF